jgi:hypothetical protein
VSNFFVMQYLWLLLTTYFYHLLSYWLLQFETLSGGLDCGHDPPAFQRAERDRTVKSQSEENANQSADVSTAMLYGSLHLLL